MSHQLLEHRLDFSGDQGVLHLPLSRRCLLPVLPGVVTAAGPSQPATQPGKGVLISELIDQAKPLGGSYSLAKCAAASLKKSFSLLSSRFSRRSWTSSERSSLVNGPRPALASSPRSIRACRTHLARLLTGMPRRWATAVQVNPSARQRATASSLCCGVNRRRARFGSFINQQSGGHGVSLIDLSTKRGKPRLLVAALWQARK